MDDFNDTEYAFETALAWLADHADVVAIWERYDPKGYSDAREQWLADEAADHEIRRAEQDADDAMGGLL